MASNWMAKNHLTLNVSKTKCMIFGTPHTVSQVENPTLLLNNVEVEIVTNFKYLGVVLDQKLTFSDHVTYMKTKIVPRLKMLGRTRRLVDQETSLQLYKSIIAPIFDYASPVYDCLSGKDTRNCKKLQNCGLRIVLKRDRRSHVKDLYIDTRMHYLVDRRHMLTMCLTYKGLNEMAPQCISEQLKPVGSVHNMTHRSMS